MRACIPVVLSVLISAPAAFPQAAAESVLLNSNSATATAKAGTTLGNALNKTSDDLAGRIEKYPRAKVIVHKKYRAPQSQPQTPPAAPTVAKAGGASLITSIQGGRVTHSSAPPSSN